MKKVLIISYYWPPAGGGGVQRWLKFAKYLPDYHWKPIIFTPENADYPLSDPELINEVSPELELIRLPILEPYRAFRSLSGKKKDKVHAGFISTDKKPSRLSRILGWTRGNLFIPDARVLWVKPAVKRLKTYLKEHPVDVIVSTGPPHSMHLIARAVHRETGIPWLADFRDPWVNMDNLEQFQLSNTAMNRHRKLEKEVMSEANAVVSVSYTESENYKKISPTPVFTITNGYDQEDFEERFETEPSEFVIGHYGTLGTDRDIPTFWEVLEYVAEREPEFKRKLRLEFAGPTDALILHNASEAVGEDQVHVEPYLSHARAIEHMQRASCLILVLNQNGSEPGRIPGKIFEYMASARPILGIGATESDSARLLRENQAGKMFERDDLAGMGDFVLAQFKHWKNRSFEQEPSKQVMQFSRKELSGSLAEILENLSSKSVGHG